MVLFEWPTVWPTLLICTCFMMHSSEFCFSLLKHQYKTSRNLPLITYWANATARYKARLSEF